MSSSDSIDDESTHDLIDYIVSRINLGSMLFGIIGNLICIFVLIQKSLLNRKFNWYLLALAFADLNYCFIVFANYLVYVLSVTDPPQVIYDLSKITCYLTDYVVHSIDAFCVFLTLILSIDRLYAIMNPIKSRFFLTYRFPKKITLVTYVILLLIKSPEIFLSQREFKPVMHHSNLTNKSNETYEIKSMQTDIYVCSIYTSHSAHAAHTIHDQILTIYIVYCNIFIPLIVNILPAIVILILNLALWFFIKNYTKTISTKQFLTEPTAPNSNMNLNIKRNITKSQKSHYFTIIMLGIWLLFTTIPYNTLTTYYWISELRLISIKTRLSLTIQGISSAFFNLNHCFNIIIYTIFHKDFRLCFRNSLIKLFNLNPICQLNLGYFKSKHSKRDLKQSVLKTKIETTKLIRVKKATPAVNVEPVEHEINIQLNMSNSSLNEKDVNKNKNFSSNQSINAQNSKHSYGMFIPNRNFFLFRLCYKQS